MTPPPKQYSPVERQGVNAVERIILGYHWIFREHPTCDFGIDAEIEICDDGIPSGKLIKLQIKAGKSWFRERIDEGIIFRGSVRHFDYWINHSLPVVLTLYHPEDEKIWWCHIEQSRIEKTGQGRKIIIPENQTLSLLSAPKLRSVAGSASKKGTGVPPIGGLAPVEAITFIRLIQEAKITVDVAAPRLNDYLTSLLIATAKRVPVRVIISDTDKASISALSSANQCGLDVRCRTLKDLHLKQVLVDQHTAIYGSSIDPLTRETERMVLVQDEPLIRSVSRAFEQAWSLSVKVNVA